MFIKSLIAFPRLVVPLLLKTLETVEKPVLTINDVNILCGAYILPVLLFILIFSTPNLVKVKLPDRSKAPVICESPILKPVFLKVSPPIADDAVV